MGNQQAGGFIYVDTPEAKDELLRLGFTLVSSDDGTSGKGKLWAFVNDGKFEATFSDHAPSFNYVLSNQLVL